MGDSALGCDIGESRTSAGMDMTYERPKFGHAQLAAVPTPGRHKLPQDGVERPAWALAISAVQRMCQAHADHTSKKISDPVRPRPPSCNQTCKRSMSGWFGDDQRIPAVACTIYLILFGTRKPMMGTSAFSVWYLIIHHMADKLYTDGNLSRPCIRATYMQCQ